MCKEKIRERSLMKWKKERKCLPLLFFLSRRGRVKRSKKGRGMIEKKLNIEKDGDLGKENRREDKREFEEMKERKE
jgi:hypothetical protein